MPKVGVAVMAHPRRAHYVEELVASIDAPVTVVWDEIGDRWETGRRAILAHGSDPEATHWLVIQDDAVVCRDLVASVEKAVRVVGGNPLSLFFSRGSNAAHQRTNLVAESVERPCLVRFAGPWWGVAVVLPVELIEQMMTHADVPRESRAYDKRMSRALTRMGVDCYYVLPSLVDHRVDGPSMIEGREQDGRTAHHFIGAEGSALGLDWTSLPVIDGRALMDQRELAAFRSRRTGKVLSVATGGRKAARMRSSRHWTEEPGA